MFNSIYCTLRLAESDFLFTPKRLKSLASNVKNNDGDNLLHQLVYDHCTDPGSCTENYIHTVFECFCGSTVNALNEDGYNALHLAVMYQNYDLVEKLVSSFPDIDVNAKSSTNGAAALHLAARFGEDTKYTSSRKLEIIPYLVKKGGDINAVDNYGRTPIFYAVEVWDGEETNETITCIRLNGGDFQAKDHTGMRPFEIVFKRVYTIDGREVSREPDSFLPLHDPTLVPKRTIFPREKIKSIKMYGVTLCMELTGILRENYEEGVKSGTFPDDSMKSVKIRELPSVRSVIDGDMHMRIEWDPELREGHIVIISNNEELEMKI